MLRHERGLTQRELAGALNVSFQTVSKWERGLGYPDVKLLPLIADALGISVDSLLGYAPRESQMTSYYRLYQSESYYWGLEPTPICYKILELYPPNRPLRLLEIGCGEGRDAVFFARNGYDVSAFDIAPGGVDKVKRLMARLNLHINVFCADMLSYKPSDDYDIVYSSRSLQYLPPERRADVVGYYKSHTKSGGLHAIMTIVSKETVKPAPDSEKTEYLQRSGELFTLYSDWNLIYIDEKIIDCNSSGVPHRHCVNLMLATKP